MIEFLNVFLPITLYIVGIITLIIVMVLGIKLIGILDKVDRVVDNIEDKVNSLNFAFSLIDKATDSITTIGNTVLGAVNNAVYKVFKNKDNEDVEEEDYYE